jgi:hypothetical protein
MTPPMNPKSLFVEAVRPMEDLPASLREHAADVTAQEEHRFEESYVEFLGAQIRLHPRGPEWAARLTRRRAALLPFCGVTLLRGTVQVGNGNFTVEVQPETRAVIHWEEYEQDSAV